MGVSGAPVPVCCSAVTRCRRKWTRLHLGASLLFLFGDYVLDVERRELRCGQTLVAVEPQVFDLLVYVVQNRDRVVSKDDLIAGVWNGRIVSESTLTSRINAARKAIGDSGDQQRFVRTVARKGIRFVGAVREGQVPTEVSAPVPTSARNQDVTFCRNAEGINLALAAVGAGPPLIKVANWLTHIEYDWESPIWSPLLQQLAAHSRLIRYDGRGNGLADRNVAEISFPAFLRDLETVVDSVGVERSALLGISQGAAVAIAYAVRHPERVSKLILFGAYAQGRNKRGSAAEAEMAQAFVTIMRHGWGDERSAFMQAFSSVFFPNGSPQQIKWLVDLQRVTTSAENAVRIRMACDDIDVVDLLPKVQVPTLVLHCRHDNVAPFEQGRLIASSIPHAKFVTLESVNHVVLADEPAWPKLIGEIAAFLAE
jgi:DNA-binding winged helix-turn-helix (wHTH) protein/pimeloyl-ACP methyl ester carboxylesterase